MNTSPPARVALSITMVSSWRPINDLAGSYSTLDAMASLNDTLGAATTASECRLPPSAASKFA